MNTITATRRTCESKPTRLSNFIRLMICAFGIGDKQSLTSIDVYLESCTVDGHAPAVVLVDAHVPGSHGGTGQIFPWELLADFSPGVPLILAGGLTPDNVAKAIRMVRPYAVDVASGVESSPGKKDADKMKLQRSGEIGFLINGSNSETEPVAPARPCSRCTAIHEFLRGTRRF